MQGDVLNGKVVLVGNLTDFDHHARTHPEENMRHVGNQHKSKALFGENQRFESAYFVVCNNSDGEAERAYAVFGVRDINQRKIAAAKEHRKKYKQRQRCLFVLLHLFVSFFHITSLRQCAC